MIIILNNLSDIIKTIFQIVVTSLVSPQKINTSFFDKFETSLFFMDTNIATWFNETHNLKIFS